MLAFRSLDPPSARSGNLIAGDGMTGRAPYKSMTLIVRGEPREFGRDKALVVATEGPNGTKAHYSLYTHPVG